MCFEKEKKMVSELWVLKITIIWIKIEGIEPAFSMGVGAISRSRQPKKILILFFLNHKNNEFIYKNNILVI